MLPVYKPPSSPMASMNADGVTSVHTQLGSSSALAQRYCIPHSPIDAASPSAGSAYMSKPIMTHMPAATDLLARVQLQHEVHDEQHRSHQKMSPAAAAASAAGKAVDAINYHLLNERVSRIESAVATMATTVSQLVQLLSVAAESSPQAAAAIWSTAAQLTATEIPVLTSSKSSASSSDRSRSGVVPAEAASPAREFSHQQSARGADGSCVSAAAEKDSSSLGLHEVGGIAAPEFNLRHRIVRVADLHERLCAIPSGLPSHEAVTVSRH